MAVDIPVLAPADVTTPAAGTVTLFKNTESTPSGQIYYMDENRNIFPLAGLDANDCMCEIADKFFCKVGQALATGIMTTADIITLATPGIQWVKVVDPVTGTVSVQFSAVS